jgi:hypothetical protein
LRARADDPSCLPTILATPTTAPPDRGVIPPPWIPTRPD